MPLRSSALLCALLVGVANGPAHASLESLKGFDKDLAEHGVTQHATEPGMKALLALVREQIEEAEQKAEKHTGKDRKRWQAIADASRGVLDRATAASTSSDPAAVSETFDALKSFLYSLRTEVRGEAPTCLFLDIIRLFANLWLKVPYVAPEDRARPLTPDQARLEATHLVDPASGTEYADPAQLAGLSADDVARLDVRRDDYLWHDDAALRELKAAHGTAWNALEARAEAGVSETLHAPYKLSTARRVLVFRDIRQTATTPKIDAEDLQGQPWKVKWGEEVQTEPVANHLYAELGGKLADLVYANKGPDDLVLVLGKSGTAHKATSCESIATFDDFKRCLRASTYKFDVSAHVVTHGVISESMLREEPFASAGPASALVGREFVTFNESLVEFQSGGDGRRPLGAAPLSIRSARSQRAMRGLAVFTYWIHNKDAKDANSHGIIDVSDASYVQYFHDMGASLGSLKFSGNPNFLKVGDVFVRRRGDHVKFRSNVLYLPKAFHDATFSDALWMARKIAGLTREEVLAAVAASRWPDFQQDVLASRLIARRNAIARAFDIDSPMPFEAAPTVVSLRTPDDRRAAVARYDLAIAADGDAEKARARLEEFMSASGIVITEGIAEFEDRLDEWTTKSKYGQAVLETTPCKKSVMVAWLERTVHPAGLARRLYRRSDDHPLKACQPTPRSLDLP